MRGKYQRKRERKAIGTVEARLNAIRLDSSELPKRVCTALAADSVETLLDLAKRSEEQLLAIKNIGQAALAQIRDVESKYEDVAKYRSVMGIH